MGMWQCVKSINHVGLRERFGRDMRRIGRGVLRQHDAR
jgi:hypothetical protein